MDIEHLRQSLNIKRLSYYEENRSWLVKMRIWKDYDGIRRPSSGYIIATLSILESELKKILPFILDLNNNPDQIIAALGLHFNPEQELNSLRTQHSTAKNEIVSTSPIRIPLTDLSVAKKRKQVLLKMNTGVSVVAVATPVDDLSLVKPPVPVGREQIATEIPKIPSQNILFAASHPSSSLPSWIDEFCRGRGNG